MKYLSDLHTLQWIALVIGCIGIGIMCYAALITQGTQRQKKATLLGAIVLTSSPAIEYFVNDASLLFFGMQFVALAGAIVAFTKWGNKRKLIFVMGVWIASVVLLAISGYLSHASSILVTFGMGALGIGFSLSAHRAYLVGGVLLAISSFWAFAALGIISALVWGTLNVIYSAFTILGIHRASKEEQHV